MKYPIVFYDGDCGMCNTAVQFIVRFDKKDQFFFAPLGGETAVMQLSPKAREANSIVLLESPGKACLLRSKAVFRISWILGGFWALPGLMSFLPSWLFDWGYRIIANNRMFLSGNSPRCFVPTPTQRERFLP